MSQVQLNVDELKSFIKHMVKNNQHIQAEGKVPVAKFLSTIINKIRDGETKGVFFCLDVKEHEELIQEASMFVDKVLHYTK